MDLCCVIKGTDALEGISQSAVAEPVKDYSYIKILDKNRKKAFNDLSLVIHKQKYMMH
jgi:hypothetical protein